MTEEKSKERLEVLERIKEYENLGGDYFNKDVEIDPPSKVLNPDDVDYLNKKFKNKIKRFFARKIGNKLIKTTTKLNEIEICGMENLKDFKGPAIFTSNHFAHFESACISNIVKKLNKKAKMHIVIKEGNYSMKGMFGFLFRHCDTIPLSSNMHTLKNFNKAISEVLGQNDYILVYPEQSMWWNYRKPRPQKTGAAHLACKNNVPIIPCFVTMQDLEKLDEHGFKVQKYTVHIMMPIYPMNNLSLKENVERMTNENYLQCVNKYEQIYKTKLTYGEN